MKYKALKGLPTLKERELKDRVSSLERQVKHLIKEFDRYRKDNVRNK